MAISLVPLTVICTKYDVFAGQLEPLHRKIICSAIRYMCHKNGADCVFVSVKEEIPMKLFRKIMNWHIFRFASAGAGEGEVGITA